MKMKKTMGLVTLTRKSLSLVLGLVIAIGIASSAEARDYSHGSHYSRHSHSYHSPARHNSNFGITIRLGGLSSPRVYPRYYMPVRSTYINDLAYQAALENYYREMAIRQRIIEQELIATRYLNVPLVTPPCTAPYPQPYMVPVNYRY